MKTCLFAGTFDPITVGHVEIINKCKQNFDKVYVVVGVNDKKTPFFSLDERLNFIKELFFGDEKIIVDFNQGLTADYVKRKGIDVYVRGIRNDEDLKYEKENEKLSKKFFPELKTEYYFCDKKYIEVSSNAVKEKLKNGEDVSLFLPKEIKEKIIKCFNRKK